MNLKPLDDRIVIKQSEAEEKTSGGIILPDAAIDGILGRTGADRLEPSALAI